MPQPDRGGAWGQEAACGTGGPRALLLIKVLYLLQFAAVAFYLPYFNLYLEDVGLSGTEIGLVKSLSPLVSIFAAPLWGLLSDALHLRRRLLFITIGGTLPVMLLLSRATHLAGLTALNTLYAFLAAPAMPLLTSITLEMLGRNRVGYGQLRLWGAVGWGVMAPLAGWMVRSWGLQWVFYGYVILMGSSLFLVTRVPDVEAPVGEGLGRSLRMLFGRRDLLLFMISVLVVGVGNAVMSNFLVLFLVRLGGSETLYGLSLTVTTMSEIPVYFYSAPLLRRLGTRTMVLFSFAVYVLQILLCAQLSNPLWILPLQLLGGVAFGGLWSAGVAYVAEQTPPGLEATAQSVFGMVFMSLASSVGATVGGVLYDSVGPVTMFRLAGLVALLGWGFFWWVGRRKGPGFQSTAGAGLSGRPQG